MLYEQPPYFSRQVHVENVRYARDPVTYPRPLPGTFQKEEKEKKKRRIDGMGMARANVNGKGVAASISCSCALSVPLLLAAKAGSLLLGSWPILTRSYRTARPTRCHPKTNNNARVSLPGGPLLFSKRRQLDFTFVMYISPYPALLSLNEQSDRWFS